jgi:hypothetical protein
LSKSTSACLSVAHVFPFFTPCLIRPTYLSTRFSPSHTYIHTYIHTYVRTDTVRHRAAPHDAPTRPHFPAGPLSASPALACPERKVLLDRAFTGRPKSGIHTYTSHIYVATGLAGTVDNADYLPAHLSGVVFVSWLARRGNWSGR